MEPYEDLGVLHGDVHFWGCLLCGSVVYDKDEHNLFHNSQTQRFIEGETLELEVSDTEIIQNRIAVFEKASALVAPFVEQHGLENQATSSGPFSVTDRKSKVEQHLDAVLWVANWLILWEE